MWNHLRLGFAKYFFAVLALLASIQAAATPKNFLLIAVDDLRPMFGRSFGVPEVLTPNMDKFFLDSEGSAFQNSYVQIAVCGPSRASILTGRRPDTTRVQGSVRDWCWCQRSNCQEDKLFMTLPTYLSEHGFVTAGVGKIFHPDGCTLMHEPKDYGTNFSHRVGDDIRGWNHGSYGVEGRLQRPFDIPIEQFSEEQWGTIPGPRFPEFNHTKGPSWMKSPLKDEQQTDGQIATHAIERLANFSAAGIGKGSDKPFFHAVGFHKPHTPWIVPEKYFDLYNIDNVSLPPNPNVPVGFKEENWHANGNQEIKGYTNMKAAFDDSVFGFHRPVDVHTQRQLRLAYFAATSFIDAQIGRVLTALDTHGYSDNTVVALWSDHGYHLGDTNSWCKMTNFEKATRNTLMWRVPGQSKASRGRNRRLVEMLDFFPTVLDLMGVPQLPQCTGLDQPPEVKCLQGHSYADEFFPGLAKIDAETDPKPDSKTSKNAFSQWPYSPAESPGVDYYRMGYSVRSPDGFRLTEYVPYDTNTFTGDWTHTSDAELYDYNTDPNETVNQATNQSLAPVLSRLKAALRQQFSSQ